MDILDYIEKKQGNWQSLSQLRDYILHNTSEKITDFDGIELKTKYKRKRRTYTLYNGTISWI
jgi:hypothetical protein